MDCSGKCGIEETRNPADRVYGVLFEISLSDSGGLDDAEGLGHGYRKGDIQVMRPNGISTAVVYFATERDPDLRPYNWYKAFVVEGALEHGLPEAYIEGLKAVPSQPDPNAERHARNKALLVGKGDDRKAAAPEKKKGAKSHAHATYRLLHLFYEMPMDGRNEAHFDKHRAWVKAKLGEEHTLYKILKADEAWVRLIAECSNAVRHEEKGLKLEFQNLSLRPGNKVASAGWRYESIRPRCENV